MSTTKARADGAPLIETPVPQYSRRAILAIWVATALPVALLAWVAQPFLVDRFTGVDTVPMAKSWVTVLAVGQFWQFVLVAALVWREQHSLRWSVVRDVLWLRSPQSPHSGRIGGRVWLVVIPLIVAFAAMNLFLNGLYAPESGDIGMFLDSDVGQTFMRGNWLWFAPVAVPLLFTVFGEELLFRGFLLPRMNGTFGRWDWVVNGMLFAAWHVSEPWKVPAAVPDMFLLSYPTKRYRSAWIGLVVHGAQSVFFGVIVLMVVLG